MVISQILPLLVAPTLAPIGLIPIIMASSMPPAFLPLSLLSILYSKSAQLPFSTWPLNAISAPTPISSLSHSSTMVIAGVFRYYY